MNSKNMWLSSQHLYRFKPIKNSKIEGERVLKAPCLAEEQLTFDVYY